MPVNFLEILRQRLLTQKTLTCFCEQGRWLNSVFTDFKSPIVDGTRPTVLLYGSAVTGTAFDTGDADYAVLFAGPKDSDKNKSVQVQPVAREQQEQLLSSLFEHLRAKCREGNVDMRAQRIFRARIPIVKCHTGRNDGSQDFDISLSGDGMRNSLLMRQYMRADARLRAGTLCVKAWGKCEQILNARHGWISPYALTIMYIFYAQKCGLTSQAFDESSITLSPLVEALLNEGATPTDDKLDETLPWQEVSPDIVLSDIQGFFRFYGSSEFDFDSDVVDIRNNAALQTKDEWRAHLSDTKDHELWHLLGHEVLMLRDPFESHNLGRSVDFFKAESIRERFRLAATVTNPLSFLK